MLSNLSKWTGFFPLTLRSALVAFTLSWLPLSGTTQDTHFFVSGQVIDAHTKQPLQNVHVSQKGSHHGATTDAFGKYVLKLPKPKKQEPYVLEFSFLGYEKALRRIRFFYDQELVVKLQPKIFEIEEVTIPAEPEVFFGDHNFQIFDYELSGDKILLITYRKRLGKAKLMVVDQEKNILATHNIPSKPIRLHKDCLGDIHLVTHHYQFYIDPKDDLFELVWLPPSRYSRITNPCIAKSGPYLYYQKEGFKRFEVAYYLVDPENDSARMIRHIRDEEIIRRYRDEQAFVDAGSLAKNDFRVAYHRTIDQGFAETILWTGIYTPLLHMQDSLFLFNHQDDVLEVYSQKGRMERFIPIDYHRNRHWKPTVLGDSETGRFYTLVERKGYSHIMEIDLQQGTLNENFKLPFRYVEKIKIENGMIFFLYRKPHSLDTKHLYFQRI